jgi:hypothetical protein
MFQPLLTVLGISNSQATAPKVLAFDGRFLVPANYWAHQDALRSSLPALTNDEPIAIAYKLSSPVGNTNIVAYLKNGANRISQLVNGKSVLPNAEQVQGFATFLFTKNQFSPVPASLNDSQVMYWEPAKYVARLRTLKTDGSILLLKTNMAAGHGGASGRYDFLREVAFDFAFVLTQLGIGKA